MGLLEEGLARIEARQLERLADVQAAEKRDRQAYKFATYQGKNTVDGTDIVSVNGASTSGFKLMSNAALSKGDRVSLRPNQQGGLQRVDAQNIAPDVAIDEKVFADVKATLIQAYFWVYSTYGYVATPSVFAEINTNDLDVVDYIYDGDKIRYKKKGKLADLSGVVFKVTEDTANPDYVVGMDQSLCSFLANFSGDEGNGFTINLNQSLPIYPDPWINPVNSSGQLASPNYGAYIDFTVFFPRSKFRRKLQDIPFGRFTESDAPFEFEVIVNGVVTSAFDPLYPSFLPISFFKTTGRGSGWILSYFNFPAIAPNLSQYTMSFRFRKRGNETWFSL